MIEKQAIVNLCNYGGMSYASVVLSDSKIAFLGERMDEDFQPFFYCFVYIQCCIIKEVCCQILLSSIHQEFFFH